MFCSKCGKEIFDEAVVCPYCGCAINDQNKETVETATTQNPKKAKKLGIAFIICGAVNVLLYGAFRSNFFYYVFDAIVRWLGSYSRSQLIEASGSLQRALVVISVLILILGVVFTAIKKPLVSKNCQTLLAVLMTIGLAVLKIMLLIPFLFYLA